MQAQHRCRLQTQSAHDREFLEQTGTCRNSSSAALKSTSTAALFPDTCCSLRTWLVEATNGSVLNASLKNDVERVLAERRRSGRTAQQVSAWEQHIIRRLQTTTPLEQDQEAVVVDDIRVAARNPGSA